MNKPRLDLEIARALRSNDDVLALELMRQRDAQRLRPRPLAKVSRNPTRKKQGVNAKWPE